MADNSIYHRIIVPKIYTEGELKKWVKFAIFIALFGLTVGLLYLVPQENHWFGIFRPATLRLISLKNPYDIKSFFNPPWGLIPLIPFSLLPVKLGRVLYAAISMFGLGYAAWRMGARKWIWIAFMLMPLTIFNGLNVNLDWMVAIGFLLPPRWGLFLILLKPQLGIGLAFYWFIQAFRSGGIKNVATTFGPVGLAFALSFILYGNYFAKASFMVGSERILWYTSIPVATVLLALSLRTKTPGYAIAAGPFLAPYINPASAPIALLGLINNPHLAIPALLGMWVLSIDPIVYLITMFK